MRLVPRVSKLKRQSMFMQKEEAATQAEKLKQELKTAEEEKRKKDLLILQLQTTSRRESRALSGRRSGMFFGPIFQDK